MFKTVHSVMPNQEHKAAHPEAVILSEVHTQFVHEFGD